MSSTEAWHAAHASREPALPEPRQDQPARERQPLMAHGGEATSDVGAAGVWSARVQAFAEAIRPTPAQRAEERRIISDALRRVHGESASRESSSSSSSRSSSFTR